MIAGMKRWLAARLSRKLFFALAASLSAVSLAFLVLFVGYYRGKLIAERATTSTEINGLLQVALENAMLKRDLKGLQSIVEQLGQEDTVSGVMILNPAGEVRFAAPAAQLGRRFNLAANELCPECSISPGTEKMTAFVEDDNVGSVLRSVNPVANKKPCMECHGSAESNPINGILVVDYEATQIKSDALAMALVLTGSGIIALLSGAAAIGWVIHRSVLAPVQSLKHASLALSDGRFDIDLPTAGHDELAELGRTFGVMSERLNAQQRELERREEFLQSLIDAIPDGIRVIGEDYTVIKANKAFCEQQKLRPDEVVRQPCYTSSHAATEPCAPTLVTCPIHELAIRNEPLTCRHIHKLKDSSEIAVEVSAASFVISGKQSDRRCIVESVRDLSSEIHHSHEQRLSEIGQLGAGVAHEIRNPLSSIHLSLQSMRKEVLADVGKGFLDHLNVMDGEIDRCIQITDRLLKLSSPPSALPELVSLNQVVLELVSLLNAEAERVNVKVELDLQESLRVVATDSDMRMLVLNLMQNAFHAMPEGGTMRISGRTDDSNVHLKFEDTGVGISAEHMPRIFQPFWSRRADGASGTGLGLSICREILRRHKGNISATSEVGKGSVFKIVLPWAEAKTEAA